MIILDQRILDKIRSLTEDTIRLKEELERLETELRFDMARIKTRIEFSTTI